MKKQIKVKMKLNPKFNGLLNLGKERGEDLQNDTQHLKAEIAKKLQWYKQQQCDGGLEVDILSVINDLKQLAAIE